MPIALGEGTLRRRGPLTAEPPSQVIDDWSQFKATGCVHAHNRLIVWYMRAQVRPMAVRVRSGLPSQVDLEDLVQQGYLGLVDAMRRFDVDRATRFETFSRPRIFGAMQDYLRAIDPVPRLTRTRSKRLAAVHERFRKQHGRPPTDDELRPLLGGSESSFRRTIADRSPAMIVPFSNVPGEAGYGDGDVDAMGGFEDHAGSNPDRDVEKRDLQRWLVRGLDGRDRLIVVLYYYEKLTMHEVGRAIGISESRVSQRLESIIECLRSRLVATGAEEEFVF